MNEQLMRDPAAALTRAHSVWPFPATAGGSAGVLPIEPNGTHRNVANAIANVRRQEGEKRSCGPRQPDRRSRWRVAPSMPSGFPQNDQQRTIAQAMTQREEAAPWQGSRGQRAARGPTGRMAPASCAPARNTGQHCVHRESK